VTAFCERIAATPAVGEYATVQRTAAGVTGTMKRCYSYVRNGRWLLIAGYQVGEMISDWVGQAQYDPQLYGYIEGAPPVPSENLTVASANPDTQDFANASKVTFTQTDKVTSALHSGRESKAEWAAKVNLEWAYEVNLWLVVAPLGIGGAKPAASVKAAAKYGLALEGDNGWTNEMDVSQATGVTRATTVGLNGQWEDAARIAYPGAGRRYVPANTGFAVVRSETADVYALRLARNRALVAFRMVPNPDIPRDWNIITFPINPLYVKQGTLDGAIGYDTSGARALDPSYPMAATPGDFSYYRPREAYALKRRIELERHRLKGFYDAVSTETGAQSVTDVDKATERGRQLLSKMAGQQVEVGGSASSIDSDALSRRNLANTYVWTAAGGFFAESTDTTDVVTETSGGSWSLKGTATMGGEFSFDAFGGSMSIGFELSLAGSHSQTRTKKTETEESFTLAVECAPGRALAPGPGRRVPVHVVLPGQRQGELRGLLRQGGRSHLARAERRGERGRPPPGPAGVEEAALLAHPAPGHVREPGPPHGHGARQRDAGGRRGRRLEPGQQLRAGAPAGAAREAVRHHPGQPGRGDALGPRHAVPGAHAASVADRRLPRPVLRGDGLREPPNRRAGLVTADRSARGGPPAPAAGRASPAARGRGSTCCSARPRRGWPTSRVRPRTRTCRTA
jgi:hypothetical protein